MPIPNNISFTELKHLMNCYDQYIQRANDDDKYSDGWRPVCLNEYFDCEFQEEISELAPFEEGMNLEFVTVNGKRYLTSEKMAADIQAMQQKHIAELETARKLHPDQGKRAWRVTVMEQITHNGRFSHNSPKYHVVIMQEKADVHKYARETLMVPYVQEFNAGGGLVVRTEKYSYDIDYLGIVTPEVVIHYEKEVFNT